MSEDPKPPVKAAPAASALIPQDLDQAYRMAQALSRSGDMVPQAYQGKPEAALAAILRGAESGLTPMQSLQYIAVVNGRPVLHSEALPALVLRAGHRLEEVMEGEGMQRRAVCILHRRDTGQKISRAFSMGQAKSAGLLDKKGPWQQYPDRMLAMRARGYAIRDGAPDALLGLEPMAAPAMRDVTPSASTDEPVIEGELTRTNIDPATGAAFVDPDTGQVLE